MEFNQNKMLHFRIADSGQIELCARGMPTSEVLDFFGLSKDDLNSEDKRFFAHHYRSGRAGGINTAVDRLFNQMSGKGGGQVALSYLSRFSEDWESDKAEDGELKGKKSFTITFDKGE